MSPASTSLADWLADVHDRAQACLARATPAMGRRYGLIRFVQDLPTEPDDARLFHAAAQTANSVPLFQRPCFGLNGGSGLSRQVAWASAIGESLERYSAAAYDESELVEATYEQLAREGMRVLDPGSVPLYSHRQYSSPGFPFRPFQADTRISWVRGRSLVSGEHILVPACLVFIPFEKDSRIYNAISTGLACDISPVGAALRGLYEVVERDAIMIMWLGRLPVPEVDLELLPSLGEIFERVFRPSRLEFRVSDITTDLGIPVAFAMAIDRSNAGVALTAGAAASLQPEHAVLKALVEAAQGRLWLRNERDEGRLAKVLDKDQVATFHDHVRWFGHQQHLEHVSFLLSGPRAAMERQVRDSSLSAENLLHALASSLAGRGLDVIVVDITPTDVAQLGFNVVKTLVPGLVDLNSHHLLSLKGNSRLYEVPRLLNYGRRDENGLYDIPHPFP
jgi:ribosomal protein S12 methylthiotransferase accessory factor